ncbi:MAG: tetratricopeptide (TPR) repeat protein [Chlamydiales bacterium]
MRALLINEKNLKPDDLQLASNFNNLAFMYHDWGKYSDAEKYYDRAMKIFEGVLGPSHPHVATGIDNLDFLYND